MTELPLWRLNEGEQNLDRKEALTGDICFNFFLLFLKRGLDVLFSERAATSRTMIELFAQSKPKQNMKFWA
jgi:hypothetical protein